MTIETVLEERGKTHGDFAVVATIYDELLQPIEKSPNWNSMSSAQRLAITMILSKLARAVTGNADEVDHYRDVAGYAQLVVRDLEKK